MYVVIGANGYLGAYVLEVILESTNENIIAVDRNIVNSRENQRIKWVSCDITSMDEVNDLNKNISIGEPKKIVYLAAYHHPDEVKKNPKLAWNINIIALSAFINSIDNVKCLFYPSTEMVYGSNEEDYRFTEYDELHPVNLYGKHKVLAEKIITTYGYNVVRFPFLIGTSLLENKKHFYDEIVEVLTSGNRMEMFHDAKKSPLDFYTAAFTLISLIENYTEDIPKILNISGDEDLTKYDIGLRIAKKLNCSEELVVPISMEKDTKIFSEKRASCTLLDNSMVKKVLNIDHLKMKL